MTQPQFKQTANFGDASPIESGGAFLFIDQTGVYCPELEILQPPDDDMWNDDEIESIWTISRILLEPCTYQNNVLSDNSFHPDSPAWFAKELQSIADCMGSHVDDLIENLCSSVASQRAQGYLDIIGYYGCYEFDQYPLRLTESEVNKRYPQYV